jgi:hypothetical protein
MGGGGGGGGVLGGGGGGGGGGVSKILQSRFHYCILNFYSQNSWRAGVVCA